MKANCPSCGAEVQFKSSISVFSVCGHCRSMIVRHDMDLDSLGLTASLPDDVSPLKIGSRGKYRNTAFEVIGRLKVAWSEGYWNEWVLLFDNGRNGWLAEAMGFFMLSAEVKETRKVPALRDLKVGKGYEVVHQRTLFVDDIKEAVCIGSEGELPFKGLAGRKTTSVDLSNHSDFACIEYSEQDGVRLFMGTYVELSDLGLTNLRDLSSDLKKVRAAGLFKCPSCGGPVSLLTPGHTASVACGYCGSVIDATNRNMRILQKANEQIKISPLIQLGSRGKLSETEWEAVGFMRRSDETGAYMWDEYLLFNPYRGFRWLTTYNGHWNFVEMLRGRPVRDLSGPEVRLGDKSFRRFLAGKAKVVYVLGEFYWRVRTGDTVNVADFICPPEILSRESDSSEAVWSIGKYIEPEEIGEAFQISGEMSSKTGVAPNQPSPYAGFSSRLMTSFFGFAILLTVLQFYSILTALNKEVYRGEFTFSQMEARSFVTPSFEIPGEVGNLDIVLHSPVKNDWLETSIELVSDDSVKNNVSVEQGVEYYYGSDWTEGSQSSDLTIPSVAGGRYHLLIQPAADPARYGDKTFTLTLRRGVVAWSNYVVSLLLLGLYPAFVCWRSRAFEINRWSESDFSPYDTGQKEED